MYHAIELSVQVRLNRYGVMEAISYKMAKEVLVMPVILKKQRNKRITILSPMKCGTENG